MLYDSTLQENSKPVSIGMYRAGLNKFMLEFENLRCRPLWNLRQISVPQLNRQFVTLIDVISRYGNQRTPEFLKFCDVGP